MRSRSNRPRHRGLRILLILLVLTVAGCWFFYDQQNRIQTEELTISSPRLPAAFDGLRIVQVSDLHGKEFGAGNAALLEKVAQLKPDIIAVTGDIIDNSEQFSIIEPVARGLAAIAPTYYVTGNHEWAIREAYTVKSALRECGVTVLSNQWLPLERDGLRPNDAHGAGGGDPAGPGGPLYPPAGPPQRVLWGLLRRRVRRDPLRPRPRGYHTPALYRRAD